MDNSLQILFFLETLIFISVIFMHLSKKNSSVVSLYMTQSLFVVILLFSSSISHPTFAIAIVAIVFLFVKVIFAPYFFRRLIKRNQLKFSSSTYLNGPMTLIILASLIFFTYSKLFYHLTILSPENANALLLTVAMALTSIFLIINRKGVLSQMIGILSLENALVSFAFFSGLEQIPGLQLGIIFDILVWIIIAIVFASMIYRQFGSLDVSLMKQLKEE